MRNEQQLKEMTNTYFKRLYESAGPHNFQPLLQQIPASVNAGMNQRLVEPVSMEEITQAMQQLGAHKAPGPDGMHGLFFKTHWPDISQDIYTEIQGFFNTGYLNPAMNNTLITLIPKFPNPEKLEHFRSISLCNFVYKIISKVLTNRLKPLLQTLIVEEQNAFVEGRLIQDNILLVQEVLHRLRTRERKKKFQALLKLDMQKAYNKIEWDFLSACLTKMGFCAQWVHWVMQCVPTV